MSKGERGRDLPPGEEGKFIHDPRVKSIRGRKDIGSHWMPLTEKGGIPVHDKVVFYSAEDLPLTGEEEKEVGSRLGHLEDAYKKETPAEFEERQKTNMPIGDACGHYGGEWNRQIELPNGGVVAMNLAPPDLCDEDGFPVMYKEATSGDKTRWRKEMRKILRFRVYDDRDVGGE